MFHIYTCVTRQHDPSLLVLAIVVAALGCITTFALLRHVERQGAKGRARWLAAAALASGSAIWATHFIAMLAFDPAGPTGYRGALTALSLLIAIAMLGAAFLVALTVSRALGGALAGLGIAAMHYTGMAAFRVAGVIVWDRLLVAESLAAGIGFASLAFVVGLGRDGLARRIAGAGLLCLAICGLHFTGMSAVSIIPDPTAGVPGTSLPTGVLAVGIALGGLLILALGVLALALEQHDLRRGASELDRMHDLADAAVEGLLVCDGARIVTANRSFVDMTGQPLPVLATLLVDDLVTLATPTAHPAAGAFREGLLATVSGEQIPVETVTRTVTYAGRPHRVIALRDLRPRVDAEARFRHLAQHDGVTGLANRGTFLAALERAIAQPSRPVAVVAIDLDRFAAVIDAVGHPGGNAALQQIALRLRVLCREEDVAACLGGDAFALIQVGVPQPAGAQAVAERIAAAVAAPCQIGGRIVSMTASIGVAVWDEARDEAPAQDVAQHAVEDAVVEDAATTLLKHMDIALRRAKRDGGNVCRFFDPDIDRAAAEARALELDLRAAVAKGELEAWFQPQLALARDSIAGFEALLRWRHPTRGLVPPNAFIPLAEQTGLIVEIGAWVLRRAMTVAQSWPQPLSVAINLSPVQFRSADLHDTITAALAATGLDPQRLELEITESMLLEGNPAVTDTLHRLRARGVRIALDDFGTGFSSLSYLRSFPFDKIKIDRSFVQELATNHECRAIVHAILGLGDSLGIATTAEGVETEEQLAYLRREGCDEVQGYLIGRPTPVAVLMAPVEVLMGS